MYELVWTALGIVIALIATSLWRQPSTPVATEPTPAATAAPPEAPPPAATVVTAAIAPDARLMARSLGDELASLVSGVEGRTHHLIEAAPTRAKLPAAAEALLSAVQRLRTLHTKLATLGHSRPAESGSTDVAVLIASLGGDLQQMQLGLELHWEPPQNLPRVDADPVAVRDAILFLCAAFLRAERGASRLSFVAEHGFSRKRPTIKLEIALEWITASELADPDALSSSACALDLEAAGHLIKSHGGELTLSHIPGKSVSAMVRLPVAVSEDTTAEAAQLDAEMSSSSKDQEADLQHNYGGALLLESDPELRAVLARELKASGRAVFSCADGASAHTFLEATPDRFELLIVDDAQQLDDNTELAKTIRSRAPDLKIFLLTPTADGAVEAWPTLFRLQKPFGVHELRRKLASILTAG